MPVSGFSGLNVALRGLMAQQRGLDVTGHNIANAERAGYSRQELVTSAASPLLLRSGAVNGGAGALLGQGVEVDEYRRIRDVFLDLQSRAQMMSAGQHEATAEAMGRAEDVLGEPGDRRTRRAVREVLGLLVDPVVEPGSTAARAAVVGQAQTLVAGIRQLDANLARIQSQATQEYTDLTSAAGPVQRAADELGRLDSAISQQLSAGRSPNDMLDRRDELLDELAGYGQVSVTDLGGGSISVQFGDAATPLVSGSTVTWPQALTAPGGRLGALLTVASPTGPIGARRTDLDAVSSQLATSVNAVHGAPPFFTGATASTLAVNATSGTLVAGTGGAAGANDVALAVAALRGGSSDSAYAGMIRALGDDAATATSNARMSIALRDAALERRTEVSGVSMDEEMTNMVRFQRAYQASARVMSAMDEALDTLINRTGRVGL